MFTIVHLAEIINMLTQTMVTSNVSESINEKWISGGRNAACGAWERKRHLGETDTAAAVACTSAD